MERFTLCITLIFTLFTRLCVCLLPDGNYAAAYTPMNDDGSINLSVIPEYAKYVADHNIVGVYVLGSGGEGPNVNLYEREAIIGAWVAAARNYNFVVIAQIGGMPVRDVMELARFCENIGVNAVAILPELYYKAKSAQEAVDYMGIISNEARSLPILYYDANDRTSPMYDVGELFNLASLTIPQFIGMKTEIETAIKFPNSEKDILVSNSRALRAAFELGFNKTVTEPSSIFPDLSNEIQRAVAMNDNAAAARAQLQMNDLMDTILAPGPFYNVKAAFEIITGIKVGPYRPPIYGPNYEGKRLLTRALEQKGVLLASPVY